MVELIGLGNGLAVGGAEDFQVSVKNADWIVISFMKIENNRTQQGKRLGVGKNTSQGLDMMSFRCFQALQLEGLLGIAYMVLESRNKIWAEDGFGVVKAKVVDEVIREGCEKQEEDFESDKENESQMSVLSIWMDTGVGF